LREEPLVAPAPRVCFRGPAHTIKHVDMTVDTAPPGLPAGIDSVLSVLSSSAVVLDGDDRVLRASAAARAFGLVDGDRLVVSELVALARKVRRDGEIREGEIDLATSRFNGRTTSFAVRVGLLGSSPAEDGLVLLLAEDQTESRRVDEVRRPWPCWPRRSRTPRTTRRPSCASPGACARKPPG
jgi:two-component system sensor histidine kinase SenX3